MMKFRNWRKKVTSILGAVCVCISLGSTALAADFKIEAQTGGILYGLYPQIGASSAINAYWDATSAYAVTDGEYGTWELFYLYTHRDKWKSHAL